MLFIVVLALLIFGPKRLPEVGRTIGKGMAQFRKATSDLKRTIETEIALEAEPPRPAGRPVTPSRQAPAQLPAASLPGLVAPVAADVPAASGDPVSAQSPAGPAEVPPAVETGPGKSLVS